MKAIPIVVLAASLAWGQLPSPAERAATAAAGLGEVLRQLLTEELKHGGFAGAAASCSESAQSVTEQYAREKGMEIRRVSLKYRNRRDMPDEWESARLRQWAASGEPPSEVFETVTENNRRFFRYLKPITIQTMCLSCHGSPEQIPADVRSLLDQRYPRDRATGYKAGDLRGAFSVTLPVAESVH